MLCNQNHVKCYSLFGSSQSARLVRGKGQASISASRNRSSWSATAVSADDPFH